MKRSESCFWRGGETLRVPVSLHSEIRSKFVEKFCKKLNDYQIEHGVVLLEGGRASSCHYYDTDNEGVFRQESYFHYLFGVEEPDYYGAIRLRDGTTTLFAPRVPQSYKIWLGNIVGRERIAERYGINCVEYVESIYEYLSGDPRVVIFVMDGYNSDSGLRHHGVEGLKLDVYEVNRGDLYPILMECRVIKTRKEIEVIRYANRISSEAHVHVMRNFSPNSMEYQIEADFMHYAYSRGGCRHVAYTCICASGSNGAILHYGHAGAPNDSKVDCDSMVLLDMGAEYYRYSSDITRTWPASGRFSPRQRAIYTAVLDIQMAIFARLKPGVSWIEMHLLAHRMVCERLLALGVLRGEIDELDRNMVGNIFMPHGLGHLLGIDTHDVGGFPPDGDPRPTTPNLSALRCGRILQSGMIVTVEPGIYFNWSVLEDYIGGGETGCARFFVLEELEKYRGFGGVRIEDDVLITEDGYENLTSVPSSIEEIESILGQLE